MTWRYASYKTDYYAVGCSFFAKTALATGVLYAIFSAWYLYAVYQYSPTVAWSIFGSQPSYLPSSLAPVYQPTSNLPWMLYMDMALGLIILIYLATSLRIANKGFAALAFVLTPVLMDSAEVMNSLAHLPYAIVPALNVASALIQAYGVNFALMSRTR